MNITNMELLLMTYAYNSLKNDANTISKTNKNDNVLTARKDPDYAVYIALSVFKHLPFNTDQTIKNEISRMANNIKNKTPTEINTIEVNAYQELLDLMQLTTINKFGTGTIPIKQSNNKSLYNITITIEYIEEFHFSNGLSKNTMKKDCFNMLNHFDDDNISKVKSEDRREIAYETEAEKEKDENGKPKDTYRIKGVKSLRNSYQFANKVKKPAQNATAQNATAQNATAQNATAQNATAQNATAQNATAQNATAQNATAQNATAQNATAQNATAQNATAQNATAQNATAQNATAQNATAQNATAQTSVKVKNTQEEIKIAKHKNTIIGQTIGLFMICNHTIYEIKNEDYNYLANKIKEIFKTDYNDNITENNRKIEDLAVYICEKNHSKYPSEKKSWGEKNDGSDGINYDEDTIIREVAKFKVKLKKDLSKDDLVKEMREINSYFVYGLDSVTVREIVEDVLDNKLKEDSVKVSKIEEGLLSKMKNILKLKKQ